MAKGQQIFMGSNKKEIVRNITKAIDNLISKIKPRYIKNNLEFRDYLRPLTIDNFSHTTTTDFFINASPL